METKIDKDWYTLESRGNPIYINDLKKSIQFNLKAYFDNQIYAEDCIQAIDEIVNGTTKAPTK
tara:strand:- start:42 stop:230 length:189 start_codon:yes stop_codon:yes gene_type:complete